jgi:PAS domain S-box-containing protein
MSKSHGPDKPKDKDLRKRAEKLLMQKNPIREPVQGDINKVLHELRVYQIELEIQNAELRSAQSKLEESLKKYSDLYEFSPIAYFTIDKDYIIQEVNVSGTSLLGVDRHYLLKKSFRSFVHADDRRRFDIHLQNTMATGATINEELRLIGNDGAEKWVHMESLADRKPEGTCVGIRAAILDITEGKRAEEAFRKSQALLRAVLEETPNPVFVKDRNSRIMMANPATLAAMGKPAEQVLGKDASEIYDDPAVALITRENDRRVMESGRTEVMEERITTPGGDRIFLSTKTPYYDPSGDIIGILGIARDITERKRQEEELEKINRTLRAISNSNQAMMHAVDESWLLRDVCRIIVEDCGYAMVWVGYAEEDKNKTVRPVAYAGHEEGYLRTLNITWGDNERGRCPAGTSIRTGKLSICRNIMTDPGFIPWREAALKLGYASSIAFPLMIEGKVFGAINIYSSRIDPFSEVEVKLLSELSADLAYGISVLRLHVAKTKSEEELRNSKERLDLAQKAGRSGTFDLDMQQDIGFWSDELLELYGFKRKEFGGRYEDWISCLVPEDREIGASARKKAMETGEFDIEFRIIRNDTGEIRWIHGRGKVFFDINGQPKRMIGINMDITERKQAEQALQESEQKLRFFIEHTPAAIAMFDRNMRYMAASRRWLIDYGLGDQDIIGRSHYEVFPEMPERWKKIHQRCLAGATERCEEDPFPRLDGRVDWVRWEVLPWYEYHGGIGGLVMFTEVITERKLVEEALQESEKRLNKSQEIAHLGSWELDLTRNHLYWSDEAYRIFGLQPQEFGASYKNFLEAVHPDDRAAVDVAYSGSLREGRDTYEIEHRIVRKSDGEIRFVHEKCEHIRDDSGKIIRSVGMVHDITERKRAEEAVRENEERYRITLESMPDAVCIQSIKDGMYLFLNKAFSRLTGYAQEEIIGKTPFDLTLPLDFEDQDTYMKCILESVDSNRLGIRYRTKDGNIINTLVSCNMVHYWGEDCAVVVITDITEYKKSEEEQKRLGIRLAQSQKMEALGTLAGGIAHDFNNILTAIIGYTEIARLNATVPEKVQKNLDNSLKSSQRAKDLVSQILAFSRHAGGEHVLITLNYTIEESLNMLRSMIPSNIEIRQNLVSSGKVMADPSQVNQMMMNLSINAAQAMGMNGGVLEVGLEEAYVDEAAANVLNVSAGPFLRLTVSDTGQGIPPEFMARIFEPYFTTKNKAGSSGLGLSIVHGIVKRHGGAITCQSTQGEGTTFEIYLPETVLKEEVDETYVQAEIPTGTERILFVDDEKSLAEVAENLLEALGYKVTALTGSMEALELIKKDPEQFDMVVTDMTMPEMMGDKLAQKILEIRPDIPVIMYTGYSEYITEDRAKSLGIRQLILKPFEIEDLAKSIRKELDNK